MYGIINNAAPRRQVNELFFSIGHSVEISQHKESLLWLGPPVVVWETVDEPKNSSTSAQKENTGCRSNDETHQKLANF